MTPRKAPVHARGVLRSPESSEKFVQPQPVLSAARGKRSTQVLEIAEDKNAVNAARVQALLTQSDEVARAAAEAHAARMAALEIEQARALACLARQQALVRVEREKLEAEHRRLGHEKQHLSLLAVESVVKVSEESAAVRTLSAAVDPVAAVADIAADSENDFEDEDFMVLPAEIAALSNISLLTLWIHFSEVMSTSQLCRLWLPVTL